MSKTKIGLGLAALGRPEYINIRDGNILNKSMEAFKENAFSVLNFAYKHGIRYFDTAPSYGKGEQFLTNWNSIPLFLIISTFSSVIVKIEAFILIGRSISFL